MYTAAQQQDWTTDTTIYPPLDKISNLWKTGRENIDSWRKNFCKNTVPTLRFYELLIVSENLPLCEKISFTWNRSAACKII